MDKQKLKQTILSNRTRVYCILDGAAINNLPKYLYEMNPPNYPLVEGELSPQMIHYAPYLIQLKSNNQFSEWILDKGFGRNQGIFVHSRSPKLDMRKHFRSLLTVHSEDGTPMLFRFYDPRVFRKFLPSCDKTQLETFFGEIDRFFVEADEKDIFLSYKIQNNELEQTEIDLSDKE